MITHSRKAVDEDGRLCFVLFFLLYFIITNKNRLFITLPFCEKQHSAALVHLLHPRSSAKPSSLHWSSSYQPFARAVRTVGLKPGSQYDAGASVASRTSRASSAKTGVPVHNLAFASVGGVVEGVSEGGSLYEPRPWRSKISATSASHAQRKR